MFLKVWLMVSEAGSVRSDTNWTCSTIWIFQIPKRLIFDQNVIFFARKSSRRGLLGKIFDKLRIQGRMQIFEKMSQSALNHVLILQKDRTQKMLQIPLKIIDLQNDFNILVAKQWKIRNSVPMSYISLFENLSVLEKSWAGATH